MIALKEIEGKRKVLVSEPFLLQKCSTLRKDLLRRARIDSNSWKHVKEKGLVWYFLDTIPNRKPHFVLDCIGNEDDLIRLAKYGDPDNAADGAKKKLLQALEDGRDYKHLYFYQFECTELIEVKENDKRSIKEIAEAYFEAYSWLVLINNYFNNGWIRLGLPTKREMMQLIVELLAEKQIKGLKITNTDSLQRKMNQFNDFRGDKRKFVIHKNYDNKHRQVVSDEMIDMFQSLFGGMDIKLNFDEVWYRYSRFIAGELEVINLETGEVYEPSKYSKVSKSTIKLYLHKYENKLGVFASRSGDWTKHKLANIPHYEFEMPKYANSLISIDDFQPPFLMRGRERAWYYGAVDLASGAWIAWVHGKENEKNLNFLLKFYRSMLINFHKWGLGLPKEIEMESSLNSLLKNSLLLPGVITDKATIYQNSPNSKKIERYIGVIRNQKAKNHPNFMARPFAKSETLSKGSTTVKEMEYEEIIKLYNSYIHEINNEPCEHDPSMTKIEWFKQNQNAQCSPIDWTKILPVLGFETKSKATAGIVRFGGDSYLFGNKNGIATGDELLDMLGNINDQRIRIFYLNDDEGNFIAAASYTEGGKYICSMHPMPKPQKALYEQSDEDIQKKEIMARYQQTITSAIKTSKAEIQDIEIIVPSQNLEMEYTEDVDVMPTLDEDTVFMPSKKTSLYDRF